ncbi:unnamed protein product [Leptidea sinapis]|uniref:phospholipase D n=1 Tax=Leptidea sinapis TaxID=189913 RepID=A0A5E4Q5H0_9NEOP|nr:unnamed protein product [Leptidea sinapis]
MNQHLYRVSNISESIDSATKRMERKELTLSFHNLIKRDEQLYSYTNYGMETPTPTSGGDCLHGVFQNLESLTPCMDSDFDESLAVPESLSIIEVDKKDERDSSAPVATSAPYSKVHAPPIEFKSVHRKVFIPGVEIKVRFVENERSVTTNLLNPNLASLKIPFPTKAHKTRRASFKNTVELEEEREKVALEAATRNNSKKRDGRPRDGRPRKRKGALPRFPRKPEVMITYEGIQLRMKQLEEYLYNLLNISIYRNHHETVFRHPDHARIGVFFWAHHEKIVCVDQTVAFLGGIDLCYGRWDDHKHRVQEVEGETSSETNTEETENIPKPDLPQLEPGDRLLIAHDKHDERRNVLDKLTDRGKEIIGIIYPPYEEERIEQKFDDSERKKAEKYARSNEELLLTDALGISVLEGLEGNSKLWIGKDYVNFIVKDFHNLDLPFVDLVDRNTTPRMPWHDIGVMVHCSAARDVARHFIQRWNAIKLAKARYVQQALEQSIHEAYVDTITRAQHYIYIENQFFITLSRTNPTVRNQIGEALFNRIMRAFNAKETFRVYVVMPLLPGFEGEVGGATGTALHAVTHWNYQSICRSRESIIARLYEAGLPEPGQYISFHGLRTHAVLDGEPLTELVYVHSKLLLADDRYLVCGSANINDRSMLGIRDSEIAVLLQDESFDDGVMNGQPFPCGRATRALRRTLFREHLGLSEAQLAECDDPCAESFYIHRWKATSKRNTEIYEEVFHTIPTDSVHTFAELKKYQEENSDSLWRKDPALANRKIDLIQGYLVDFPLEFLCNETLTPKNTSMEGMMPTSLWT